MTIAKTKRQCGWMRKRDRWGVVVGYEAYLHDPSRGTFDLFSCDTWWAALDYALFLAEWYDCDFDGGPPTSTNHLDRRAV